MLFFFQGLYNMVKVPPYTAKLCRSNFIFDFIGPLFVLCSLFVTLVRPKSSYEIPYQIAF